MGTFPDDCETTPIRHLHTTGIWPLIDSRRRALPNSRTHPHALPSSSGLVPKTLDVPSSKTTTLLSRLVLPLYRLPDSLRDEGLASEGDRDPPLFPYSFPTTATEEKTCQWTLVPEVV